MAAPARSRVVVGCASSRRSAEVYPANTLTLLIPARRNVLNRSSVSSSPTSPSGSPFLFSGSGTSAASSVPKTSRFWARPSSLPVMSISFVA